jgi:hypothetical protein
MTQTEMERILAVANENAGLRKQLEGLRTTWQLVDSDYASLLAEMESLQEKQRKISNEYDEIATQLRKVNNQLDEIRYGFPTGGGIINNAGIGQAQPGQIYSKGSTNAVNASGGLMSAIQSMKQNAVKTHYYGNSTIGSTPIGTTSSSPIDATTVYEEAKAIKNSKDNG